MKRACDDYWSPVILGIGTAHAVSGPDEDPARDVGTIWVPDPEQRHSWRERYVRDEPKPGAERRSLGFGKP